MNETLSANTQAILLLTAPLLVGRGKRSDELLTVREYLKLARHLRAMGSQPADLLTADAGPLLGECHRVIDKERVRGLLGRGFLLSLAVEHWQARAIWVVSRADAEYPKRLKARLKENSPPLLYGCGARELPNTGGLAVVGSRNVGDGLVEYTRGLVAWRRQPEEPWFPVGREGSTKQQCAAPWMQAGRSRACCRTTSSEKALHRGNRDPLLNRQLVLISPHDPGSRFNVGHAMQRNK